MKSDSDVGLWTDGSSILNPGKAGWAAFLSFKKQGQLLSGCFEKATNNQMEVHAITMGLKKLTRPCRVFLFTDSMYVIYGIERLVKNSLPKTNIEFWQELLPELRKHEVIIEKVEAHAGDPINEFVDRQAQLCARHQLSEDRYYKDATYLFIPWNLRVKVNK